MLTNVSTCHTRYGVRMSKQMYYCECDPHGDNAMCDRPCCRTSEQRRLEAEAIVAAARQVRLDREKNNT